MAHRPPGPAATPRATSSSNIENITGWDLGDDVLTGNNLANVLQGLDGADVLAGGAANDTLIGGAGDDTIDGGSGTDVLEGGDGIDMLSYAAATTKSHGHAAEGAVIVGQERRCPGRQDLGVREPDRRNRQRRPDRKRRRQRDRGR